MCNLDAERMKYVWTEETEELYQILQRVDEVEWRLYAGGYTEKQVGGLIYCGPIYYLTYMGGERIEFDTSVTYLVGAYARVYGDLVKKLRERNAANPCPSLTNKQYDLFKKCSSWEELEEKCT
jgi:hypothetical protein